MRTFASYKLTGQHRTSSFHRLLTLALEDDEGDSGADEPATDEPQISVHAITGIRTSETMQVCIQLGGISLLTLLDSGSTHNFVVEEAAYPYLDEAAATAVIGHHDEEGIARFLRERFAL